MWHIKLLAMHNCFRLCVMYTAVFFTTCQVCNSMRCWVLPVSAILSALVSLGYVSHPVIIPMPGMCITMPYLLVINAMPFMCRWVLFVRLNLCNSMLFCRIIRQHDIKIMLAMPKSMLNMSGSQLHICEMS